MDDILEDIDDLALQSPALSGKLLGKWFDDLFLKDFLANLGGQIVESLHHSKRNLAVGFLDKSIHNWQNGLVYQIGRDALAHSDQILRQVD